MSTRKVFASGEKELSYRITSSGNLEIEILMGDGTTAGITLDKADAIQFIQELNKLRKYLWIK